MSDILIILIIIATIVIIFLMRYHKRLNEFADVIPNFISFCKKNNMELVGQSTNGIIFRKVVDYKKLKDAYSEIFNKELDIPSNLTLYHYVGMSCAGEYVAISLDNNKPNKDTPFFFTNYLITDGYLPNINTNKRAVSIWWEDTEDYYCKTVENGYIDLARQLNGEIEANKDKHDGYGWYAKFLKEEELYQWQELANSSDIPKYFKNVIYTFFIPYRISIEKYVVNKDATEDPYRYHMYDNISMFSLSLKKIQENPLMKAAGYPNWFYLAFPDVAVWAVGDGKTNIKELFKSLTKEELILNNSIRVEHLKTIIDLYLSETRNQLEVSVDSKY